MVKTPTSILPSAIVSWGLYAVELRIAKGWVFVHNSKTPMKLILNNFLHIQTSFHLVCVISTDATYSSYMLNNHPPLRKLLGKPIYLELNLKSAKPDAVILVNYCLAYPRSARNALVLIYEGYALLLDLVHVDLEKKLCCPLFTFL